MPKPVKQWSNKDVFSRMNFLYQASMMMAGKNDVLSSYYGNLCKSIGKKAVLRMQPSIKRTLCKRCSVALKPGITAKLDCDDEKSMKIICERCGYKKNFVISDKYNLWVENQSAVVDSYNGVDLEKKTSDLSLKELESAGESSKNKKEEN